MGMNTFVQNFVVLFTLVYFSDVWLQYGHGGREKPICADEFLIVNVFLGMGGSLVDNDWTHHINEAEEE